MKNKFYLILVTLTFILSACEEKLQEHKKIKIEKQIPQEKILKKETPKILVKKALPISIEATPIPLKVIPEKEYHYEFKNLKSQLNTLNIKNDIYDFRNIKQPIVIINVMSTWCPPCRGQIPHLSKLQQKYKENVFVMSILVYDDIEKEKLNKLIIAQKILFYVSVTQNENLKFLNMLTPKLGLPKDFPMPLTIIFSQGKYFTHYEGMLPEEMIESDINQLLKKIKK